MKTTKERRKLYFKQQNTKISVSLNWIARRVRIKKRQFQNQVMYTVPLACPFSQSTESSERCLHGPAFSQSESAVRDYTLS